MSVLRVSATCVLLTISGCKEPTSRLESESAPLPSSTAQAPAKAAPTSQAPPPPADDPDAGNEAALAAGQPPPDAERVLLRLSLEEGTEYRVTTVGMLSFAMVQQPTGFAREERIALRDCTGEGDARTCRVHHRYTQFEAEPPTGALLEADEKRVSSLETVHAIDALGARTGETEIRGTPEAIAGAPSGLSEVHRLQCLRFPDEPVAVGAKWKSSCKTLSAGRVITRNVLWELSKLDDDPVSGKRAELHMVGEVLMPDDEGIKKGTVQGVLYFFADKGRPHQLRERLTIPLTANASSTRDIAYQFALVQPGDPETFLRTDGQPFPPDDPSGTAAQAASPGQPPAVQSPTPATAVGAEQQPS